MSLSEADVIEAREDEALEIQHLESSLTTAVDTATLLVAATGEHLRLPTSVIKLLAKVIHELAQGNAVTVVPIHADLTTQEAAELLNVSRPFLIKLLEAGEVPFYYVGSHRRIPSRDLLSYRNRRSRVRRGVLAKMAREAQEMGLYQ